MKILSALFILCSCSASFAQWNVVPETSGEQINEIEISDNFLFVSKLTDNEAFIRLDIANSFQKQVMRNAHNQPFSKYGWKEIAAINEHMMYTDMDTFFISHDYGNTWDYSEYLANQSGMYILTAADRFFVGVFRNLMVSHDSAYTFDGLYYESYYTNTTLHPLIVIDSNVYFSYEGGLVKNKIDDWVSEVLDDTPNLFYSMVKIDNKLIASSNYNIYQSLNMGNTWSVINSYPFGANFINELVYKDGLLFACASSQGLQVSFNNGQSFFSINEGLPAGTSVHRIKFHQNDIYVATSTGVYRRSLSEIVQRSISGRVFYDRNQDVFYDAGENLLVGEKLSLSGNGYTTLTDGNGHFNMEYAGIADTLKYHSEHPHYIPLPAYFYSGNITDSVNFAIQIDSNLVSAEVTITPMTNSRPGFETHFKVDALNYGSADLDAVLKLKLDTLLSTTYISDSSFILSGDTLTWNFDLSAFDNKSVRISCFLPADVNLLGDTLTLTAMLEPMADDLEPANNTNMLRQVITGSYDPNDKSVFPSTSITPEFVQEGKWLEYLVRFQNTGTDTAFTILVKDTLHPYVSASSFQFLSGSHPVQIEMDSLDMLTFRFNAINLPDSQTDEPNSHGFIRYKVKAESSLQVDDYIANTAHIYFDFNPAIVTNTTITYCKNAGSVSVTELSENLGGLLFPNPNAGIFYLEQAQASPIKIIDCMGKTVPFENSLQNGLVKISLLKPMNGLLFVSFQDESGQLRTEKILVK